jgi:TolA-binding protein
VGLAAVVVLAAASISAGDKIRTLSGIGFDGEITGVAGSGIVILVGEVKKTVPIGEISRVTSDKFPDLAKAEDAYAAGVKGDAKGLKDAEKTYKGLMGEAAPTWLRVLVQSRMFKVYAESGRVAGALDAYLEMARGSPNLVDGLKLPAPDPAEREANKAMLKKVDSALEAAGNKPYAAELKSFRAGLAIQEGAGGDVTKALEAALASDDPRIRQPAQLRQLELLVTSGKADDAAASLEEYGKSLAAVYPADVAYWNGRVLQEQKKYTEAALEFMRLPILYPTKDRSRTAEALWRAGQAMEAAKAPKAEVVKVYTEAVQRYAGTAGADSAKKELARLGASK